jgi:maltose/moltooligosaccharide transporter
MIKARLSFLQIWNMCFGFFGIQIGFGLQNANTSRIFQSLGVKVDDLAILWIAAPATGLLVQPIIGYLSDRTWGRLGRRRPYFLWGALATTAALLVMPNAPALWIAAAALWVMDASINITMEPFRAFVGDNLPDDQRTTGYAMQSLFIGLGAVLASALPWMLSHWFFVSNVAPAGGVPPSVHIAFYAGGAGLLLSVLWTVFTTREYSPDQLAAFEASDRARKGDPDPATNDGRDRSVRAYVRGGAAWGVAGLALIAAIVGPEARKGALRAGRPGRRLWPGAAGGRGAEAGRGSPRRLGRRLLRGHRGPVPDAGDHEAAGHGAVLLVVWPVRHVDLHHRGSDDAPLPRRRRRLAGL